MYERILVRPIAATDEFELLAGHNRTEAAKLAGWTDIPATVMAVNDQRAISIAIATNLLRRQDLTIIERGKAYKALLDARNRCGQRNAAVETFGDNRQRYNARKIVRDRSDGHAVRRGAHKGRGARLAGLVQDPIHTI